MPLLDASQHPDICPHCQLPILPGESHGELIPGEAGQMATLRCKVRKLQMVEEVIEVGLNTR